MKEISEKRGFVHMAGVLVFGLIIFMAALPVYGEMVTQQAIADEAAAGEEGGGDSHHH